MIGNFGLKNAIVSLLEILAFSSSKALSSSGPQWNLLSLCVSSLNGFVSEAYRGINLQRYPVMPRKLLTSAFDLGAEHSWMACTFSGVGLRPSLPNW